MTTQKSGVDEELEELKANRLIESPQTLGLSARQVEARHLQEFAAHPLNRLSIDWA